MNIVIPKSILDMVQGEAMKIIRYDLERQFKVSFEALKAEMIDEFMNHEITKEIMNGPDAENTSKTLSGRKGNLFSFIGFDEGTDPISPIIDILDSTTMTFAMFSRKGARLTIKMPLAETVFQATPMPWATGRSWTKGIESGISGLGYFIQKDNKGRSSGGIQLDHQSGLGGRFKNSTYISALINKYFKRFSSLDGAYIKMKQL